MKKHIYLGLLLILFSVLVMGQSQRLVLLEHFTQASCGPCATYNPQINNLLLANPDKFTAIMYHTSWPGYDPMYNHNIPENGARTTYYGVTSVPNSVLDGNIYNGHPSGWNITTINNRYAVPSPFEISLYQELSPGQDKFKVYMLIKATEDVDAGMKAHMVVIEKHIHFNTQPGSNGEVDFYNVMKKMLPNQNGTELPAFAAGEYVILQYSWEHQNVYDIDELAAVGFVQNNSSKEVLQSGNSSSNVFTPVYSTDAEVIDVSNVSQSYCIGNIQPMVTIQNNGSDNLTSLDIIYTINNEAPVVFQWSGSLSLLESETITMSETTFGVMDINTLNVTLSNPNGQVDDYPDNNVKIVDIPKALDAPATITLVLKLDNSPEETTWEFTNSQGEVIYEGGPYTTPGQQILEQYTFDVTDCNTFTINDAGGDGLTEGGSFAVGFQTFIIAQGNTFGSKAEGQFIISFTEVEENLVSQTINIFPNPVKDVLNFQFTLEQEEQVQYSLIDPLGREIFNVDEGIESSGQKEYILDLSTLNAGIYYLSVELRSLKTIEKIIITK